MNFQVTRFLLRKSFLPSSVMPPCGPLIALFGVGGAPAFEILIVWPVTYGPALRKSYEVFLANEVVLRRFDKFDFNVTVSYASLCFHS